MKFLFFLNNNQIEQKGECMKTKARKKNVIYEEKFTGYYFPEKHFMKILDDEVPLVIFTDDNFVSYLDIHFSGFSINFFSWSNS